MLRRGEIAPDFAFGGRSLYDVLQQYSVTVYFFPKAFTPG
jgi:peroxiredoxin